MHVNGGGQSQVLLEKMFLIRGVIFYSLPQNAAISKISNLHLFTSKEESPPKYSNFEDIKFAPFTSTEASPPKCSNFEDIKFAPFTFKKESPQKCSNFVIIKYALFTDLIFKFFCT